MRYTRWIAGLALSLGMAASGMAQDRYWDNRDLRHDYARIERLRADIARDRARMDENIRCGRERAAAKDAGELARHQRELDALTRDAYRDRRDRRWDSRNDSGYGGYAYGYDNGYDSGAGYYRGRR